MKDGTEGSSGVSRRSVLAGTAATTAVAMAAAVSGQDKPNESAGMRGSDKLLEKIGSQGHTFAPEEIREVVTLLSKTQGKIIDWCQYGQPSTDGVCGTVVVAPRLAPGVITELLKIRNLANWRFRVFPKGIPVFDEVHIQMMGGRVAGGVIIDG